MAKRRNPLHLRLRKQFTLIPGLLKWTLSRSGPSLNLKLGPFSRSWGRGRSSTSLDAPGSLGLFWRGEKRRSKRRLSGAERDLQRRQSSERLWTRLSLLVIALSGLVGLARINLHDGDCRLEGHPNWLFFLLMAAQVAFVVSGPRITPLLRGPLMGLLMIPLVWLVWKLGGALLADALVCAK